MSELILALTVVIILIVIAFWQQHAVIFLITSVMATFCGFAWFDLKGTNLALVMSMSLFVVGFLCLGMTIYHATAWGRR